jgi:hypothetical protein
MKNARRFRFLALTLALLSLLLPPAFVRAQDQPIGPEETRNYIGKQKTVCGKVASTKYAAQSKGQPTFLNLNKPYPAHVFAAVIFGSDRGKFEKPPETV